MQKVITTIEASRASSKLFCPQDPTTLPFVENIGKGKKQRVHYWQPKRAGEISEDAVTGQYYATEALQFIERHKNPDLMRRIARDMANTEIDGMLETEFWSTIQKYIHGAVAS